MNLIKAHLGRLELESPVTVASGTFGSEYFELRSDSDTALLPQSALGAYVSKTITPQPKAGNPHPRLWETECGLLNSIGLQNPGLQGFLNEELPRLRELLEIPLIVSFSASSIDEFCQMLEALETSDGIDGYEVNVSCPNVAREGIAFGADPDVVYELTSRLARITHRELMIKLSPNVSDIALIAQAAEGGGATSLALINTLWGMAIDWRTGASRLPRKLCGYSGKGIKPVALALTYKAAQAVKIPILAMGGISCWRDALEFIYAGASAIAVGTANFSDPGAPAQITHGLRDFCAVRGICLSEIVGSVR